MSFFKIKIKKINYKLNNNNNQSLIINITYNFLSENFILIFIIS